jgi:hypothetical protein
LTKKVGDLRKLLDLARLDVLGDRESRMFALRYGLPEGSPYTLDYVGRQFGLSKEGARTILMRAHGVITAESISQLESGLTDRPCARLSLFIRLHVRPQSSNSAQRLAILLMEEFRDFCPSRNMVRFIASLAYPDPESASYHADAAARFVHQQHPGCLKHEMSLKRMRKLLSHVFWPPAARKVTDDEMSDVRRRGEVSVATDPSPYYSLKMGRFVKCKSRLELDFYRLLDDADDIVEYHAHSISVPYTVKGARLTYYPDLFALCRDGRGIVVEIVPLFRMAMWWNLQKFEALKIYCDRVGFGLLVTDGYSCLEEVYQYRVKEEYATEAMRYMETSGTIDWNTYRQIIDRYHPKGKDLVGLIVQNGLALHLNPFQITYQ